MHGIFLLAIFVSLDIVMYLVLESCHSESSLKDSIQKALSMYNITLAFLTFLYVLQALTQQIPSVEHPSQRCKIAALHPSLHPPPVKMVALQQITSKYHGVIK
jgi:hypothetical protein